MVYLLGFFFSLGLSLFLTWITIKVAFKYGFVDNPKRKHGAILHSSVIPRAGGVPVYVATLLTIVSVFLFFPTTFYLDLKHLLGIFIAGFFIVVMGTLDDKYDLSPRLRLILMFFCAIVVVMFGIGVSYITNPLGGVIRFDEIILPFNIFGEIRTIVLIADIVAVLWIVCLMNIVNWSSGLDGQNAGIAVVSLGVLGFSALRYNQTSEPVALLAFVCSGAYAGFLFFSMYPQRIMPGFGGSTFSGFMIAVLSILSGAKFATAAIVLAIPIIDAGWVFVRRVLRKKNPMQNDRTHLHHYLLDIGWSKSRIAVFYWIICLVLGILSLQVNSQTKIFTFLVVVVSFLIGVLWIKQLLQSSKRSDQDNG